MLHDKNGAILTLNAVTTNNSDLILWVFTYFFTKFHLVGKPKWQNITAIAIALIAVFIQFYLYHAIIRCAEDLTAISLITSNNTVIGHAPAIVKPGTKDNDLWLYRVDERITRRRFRAVMRRN